MYREDQKSYEQVASSRAVNKAISDVISIYVFIPAKGTWVKMAKLKIFLKEYI